jgi:predicted SprT family Zn-dependent metalloprotease
LLDKGVIMAETKSKTDAKSKKDAPEGVTFKCRLCETQKPISEMKVIKRFRPVIVVCRDCEKTLQ